MKTIVTEAPVSLLRRVLRNTRRRAENLLADLARDRLLGRPFRLLVVCGQKRTGNHLFLNWAVSQRRGTCLHYNHVAPDQWPTERHRRSLHRGGGTGPAAAEPTLILSYEDRALDAVAEGALARFTEAMGDRILRRDLALVLRDPRNLLASRFKRRQSERDDPEARARLVARFAEYAGPALAAPETLHGMRFTPVFYDALIASRAYRDALSDRLDLRRGDRGLGEVTTYGHGSSFDGVVADGRSLDVGGRWKAYADDPVFQEIFASPPMDKLAPAIEAAIAARRDMG